MNKILLFVVCCGLFSIPLYGSNDLVSEYEELLSRASSGYKSALRAPESRYGQDFEKNLQHFKNVSRSLQNSAGKYGRDFNFAVLSQDIETMYKKAKDFLQYQKDGSRSNTLRDNDFREKKVRDPYKRDTAGKNRKKRSRYSNNKNRRNDDKRNEMIRSLDPLPLFKILAADLKTLQKMNFSAKTNENMRTAILIDEYKRLVNFYRSHYLSYLYRQNSPQYMKEISRRGRLMQISAQQVMNTVGRRNGGELSCNLSKETATLLRVTDFHTADMAKQDERGKKARSHHNRQEARYSFNKINETLAQLQKDFTLPVGKKVKRKVADLPAKEDLKEHNEVVLQKKLLHLRSSIFKKNTLMTGVDKNTLRQFRLTLSKTEQREFDRVRKEYTKNGYEENSAARYACVRILNTPAKKIPKRELVQIFQRYEREINKENDKEKDLEF